MAIFVLLLSMHKNDTEPVCNVTVSPHGETQHFHQQISVKVQLVLLIRAIGEKEYATNGFKDL